MKYFQILLQVFLLILLVSPGNAQPTCLNKVKQLELKKENITLHRGIWGYFEKSSELKKKSVVAIQLDSRINKIVFLLNHLCQTQHGIPLTPLAIYLSQNLAAKGEVKFEAELLSIGKTSQQIDEWFEFCRYAEKNMSRTLVFAQIQIAIDQSVPLLENYVRLAEFITRKGSPSESLEMARKLTINIDQLLDSQPYFTQALEETSNVLFWDITEGDLG